MVKKRASWSRTAAICARVTPGNQAKNWSTVAPSRRFSKSAVTGTRVPRKTQAPPTRSGSRSISSNLPQSCMPSPRRRYRLASTEYTKTNLRRPDTRRAIDSGRHYGRVRNQTRAGGNGGALLPWRMRQNWDDGYCRPVPRAVCNQPGRGSGGGQRGHDGHPVLLKPASALRQRAGFAAPTHRSEALTLLLEPGAAARGGREAAEAEHGVVALLHAPVVLRDAVVLVAAAAMGDAVAERRADSARVRVVPVGRLRLARFYGSPAISLHQATRP